MRLISEPSVLQQVVHSVARGLVMGSVACIAGDHAVTAFLNKVQVCAEIGPGGRVEDVVCMTASAVRDAGEIDCCDPAILSCSWQVGVNDLQMVSACAGCSHSPRIGFAEALNTLSCSLQELQRSRGSQSTCAPSSCLLD